MTTTTDISLPRWQPAGPAREARWRERLAEELTAERERWALWLAVALAAGIAAYFALPVEPPRWPAWAALGIACATAWLGRGRTAVAIAAIGAAAVALGFAAAAWRTDRVAAPMIDRETRVLSIEGRVSEIAARPSGSRLVLDRLAVAGWPPDRLPARVRILVPSGHDGIAIGDRVALRSRLAPPPPPAAPGAFDPQRQSYFEGIGGTGRALGRVRLVAPAEPAGWWPDAAWVARLRFGLAQRIVESLPGAPGAVAAALLTGDRSAIPEPVMEDMRASGLAHLLAISGLHMGLVAGTIFAFLRLVLALVPALALAQPIKKWAAVGAFLGASGYLLVSGASVPTQRAFVMTSVVLAAILLDRSAISPRLVAWAAAIVLLVAPESLLGASFQLSFAAVVALVAAYEVVAALRRRRWRAGERRPLGRAAAYVGAVLLSSAVATSATAFYSAFHFNQVPTYGLVANLIAVPATALWIMPWGLVALALDPLGWAAGPLALMGLGIEIVLWAADAVAGWPGATVGVPAMGLAGLVLFTAGGLWLCLWRRPWRLAGVPVMLAGLLVGVAPPRPDILVSDDGRLVAVRTAEGGLALSSARAARAVGAIWLRRDGGGRPRAWTRAGDDAAEPTARCDPLGCLARVSGQVVALAEGPGAFAEDCRVATVIVARVPVRQRCRGPPVIIDRIDLWRRGAYAIWLGPSGPRVLSVADWRGERPWTPKPRPRRQE